MQTTALSPLAVTTVAVLVLLLLPLLPLLPHQQERSCFVEARDLSGALLKKLEDYINGQMKLQAEVQTLVETVRIDLYFMYILATTPQLSPFDPAHVLFTPQEQLEQAEVGPTHLQLLERTLAAVDAKRRKVAKTPRIDSVVDCTRDGVKTWCKQLRAGLEKLLTDLEQLEEKVLFNLSLVRGVVKLLPSPSPSQTPPPSPAKSPSKQHPQEEHHLPSPPSPPHQSPHLSQPPLPSQLLPASWGQDGYHLTSPPIGEEEGRQQQHQQPLPYQWPPVATSSAGQGYFTSLLFGGEEDHQQHAISPPYSSAPRSPHFSLGGGESAHIDAGGGAAPPLLPHQSPQLSQPPLPSQLLPASWGQGGYHLTSPPIGEEENRQQQHQQHATPPTYSSSATHSSHSPLGGEKAAHVDGDGGNLKVATGSVLPTPQEEHHLTPSPLLSQQQSPQQSPQLSPSPHWLPATIRPGEERLVPDDSWQQHHPTTSTPPMGEEGQRQEEQQKVATPPPYSSAFPLHPSPPPPPAFGGGDVEMGNTSSPKDHHLPQFSIPMTPPTAGGGGGGGGKYGDGDHIDDAGRDDALYREFLDLSRFQK